MEGEPRSGRLYRPLVNFVEPKSRELRASTDSYLLFTSRVGDSWYFDVLDPISQRTSKISLNVHDLELIQVELNVRVEDITRMLRQ